MPTESNLQISCLRLASYYSNDLLMVSIPNERKSNAINTAKLKKQGLTKGFPDCILIAKNKVVFIEFKSLIGKQSLSQKQIQERLENLNQSYFLVRTIEKFQEILKTVLILSK